MERADCPFTAPNGAMSGMILRESDGSLYFARRISPYLCYKPWLEIMEELGLSETSIYRIHGEALKNFMVPRKDC